VPAAISTGTNVARVFEGSTVTLNSAFTDPSSLDTFTYNWHVTNTVGQVIADGAGSSFTFVPNQSGVNNTAVYTVVLTVTDDDSGVASSAPFVFSMADAQPYVDVTGNAAQSAEGSLYTLHMGI
jgi:hypothetical protein